MADTTLDDFTLGYITAALWSSMDEATEQGGEPLDTNYSREDIAPETMAKMQADCARFQSENAGLITDENRIHASREGSSTDAMAGHDFWLTRNHHGAGFWDGDWAKVVGEKLTTAAHAFGEVDLYIGDDGLIYS
jgi:hypothetical protein